MINQGVQDAQSVVQQGEGVEFGRYIERARDLKKYMHMDGSRDAAMEEFMENLNSIVEGKL